MRGLRTGFGKRRRAHLAARASPIRVGGTVDGAGDFGAGPARSGPGLRVCPLPETLSSRAENRRLGLPYTPGWRRKGIGNQRLRGLDALYPRRYFPRLSAAPAV